MRLNSVIATTVAIFAALSAHAETRSITGHGVAKNAAGLLARFAVNVSQVDTNPAIGRFEMGWTHGDAKIAIVSDHPRVVLVRENEGRFYGPAVVTVTRGTDVRHWSGTVYFTALDRHDAHHTTSPDLVRCRFIRDPWQSPEGDFFFEGLLTEGDVAVKKF
jgi:hypothetical protein